MAKKKFRKTNACRALDAQAVEYEVRHYEVDERDLSAETVAEKVGLPLEQVFKTLCVRAEDGEVLLGVVSAGRELDLKALARAAGKKAAFPVSLKELTPLTGYIRGGVTALACKKPFSVFVDERARDQRKIAVSAGVRGTQLFLSPQAFVEATRACWAPISRDPAAR